MEHKFRMGIQAVKKLTSLLSIMFVNAVLTTSTVAQTATNTPTATLESVQTIYEGVDYDMAKERHSVVSDIRYDISFNLPSSTKDSVRGDIIISFDYSGKNTGVLPIDFKGNAGSLHSLSLNGKSLSPNITNEHVLLPANMLRGKGNLVEMSFTSSERGINRRDGYLYTLFVPDRARCVFPCFDQPDMKASFSLTLNLPKEWKAVSNSYQENETPTNGGRKIIKFAPTEPLSTYLFAFAAGVFSKIDFDKDGRKISAYHRETDPSKIAQFDDIFRDVAHSLDWQEQHTGIKYPFSKYDLIVLPGFQFGGMEHTGATFYNDKSLFLSDNPTPDEYLRRSSLIAHETSHMWFGDLVTMRWFDDVWTKEVFANYYAATITRELLPEFDHDIEWLRDYTAAAMSEDRSEGRTTIRQHLDNMENAGLIYNNIIYNKAPVMLAKLVDLMGKDAYRDGIREYASTYSYANADWDELVEILSRHTDKDVKEFSRVWVYEKSMPVITSNIADGKLIVEQSDPLGNGNIWPQRFEVSLLDENAKPVATFLVNFTYTPFNVFDLKDIDPTNVTILPNSDGKGYGRFITPEANIHLLLELLSTSDSLAPITRMALMMALYENYLAGDISAPQWSEACLRRIPDETYAQMSATLVGYLALPLWQLPDSVRTDVERILWDYAESHNVNSCRTALYRLLSSNAASPEVCDSLYSLWESGNSPVLGEKDFMNLAYQLAVRFPDKADSIISIQRSRLSNPDRITEFDYISRAVASDSTQRWSLFESLQESANRRIEPWTATLLSLLFHPLREEEARNYLEAALMMLPEVQRHGDIFYPANWCKAVISGMHTPESMEIVRKVIKSDDIKNSLLRNKVLNAVNPTIHKGVLLQ